MNWFLYVGGAIWFWAIGLRICGIKFALKEEALSNTWFILFSIVSYPLAGLSGVLVWVWVCWKFVAIQ